MKLSKIKPTSPDKVNGKLIKYRSGDCLSIECKNGKYLAVLITGKFNKYYDFTLLEYYQDRQPLAKDFQSGRVFGTRFGSWQNLSFAVDKQMLLCKYVDACTEIEIIDNLYLIENLQKASYSYVSDLTELLAYYLDELPIRIEKTKNAEKFPDLAFVSKHLIEVKHISIE